MSNYIEEHCDLCDRWVDPAQFCRSCEACSDCCEGCPDCCYCKEECNCGEIKQTVEERDQIGDSDRGASERSQPGEELEGPAASGETEAAADVAPPRGGGSGGDVQGPGGVANRPQSYSGLIAGAVLIVIGLLIFSSISEKRRKEEQWQENMKRFQEWAIKQRELEEQIDRTYREAERLTITPSGRQHPSFQDMMEQNERREMYRAITEALENGEWR